MRYSAGQTVITVTLFTSSINMMRVNHVQFRECHVTVLADAQEAGSHEPQDADCSILWHPVAPLAL